MPPQTRPGPYLLVRTSVAATLAVPRFHEVAREVTGMNPRFTTVDQLFAQAFVQYRIIAWVAGILAGLSLVVAVVGLHGVMSFTVNQRVKEIGIRMALGATPDRVASTIIRECLYLVGLGAVVGYGLSILLTLVARGLLFGVSAFDPVASLVVALSLGAVGMIACSVPARRASKVDPMIALRAE